MSPEQLGQKWSNCRWSNIIAGAFIVGAIIAGGIVAGAIIAGAIVGGALIVGVNFAGVIVARVNFAGAFPRGAIIAEQLSPEHMSDIHLRTRQPDSRGNGPSQGVRGIRLPVGKAAHSDIGGAGRPFNFGTLIFWTFNLC